jgi:hypothetical protein
MDILSKLNLGESDFIEKLKLKEFTNEPLNNPEAFKNPIPYELDVFKIDDEEISDIMKLSAGLDVKHESSLFNEESDTDDDELLDLDGSGKALIPFSKENPVLKHDLKLNLNAAAKGSSGNVSFGIDAKASLRHFSYLRHDGEETVRSAMIKDFLSMPFAFSLSDLNGLPVGDAVAFETDGSLALDAEFSTSDIVSAGLSGLSEFIESEELLRIDFELGAKATVAFSVKDSYRVVFLKHSDTHYKVSVNKSKNRSTTLGASVSVSAGIENNEELSSYINNQLDKLIETVTGEDDATLKTLEDELKKIKEGKIDFIDLDEEYKEMVEKLLQRLKIGDVVDKATALIDKFKEIRKTVKEKIVEGAKSKLEASFAFEYKRVSSESLLFQAIINETILGKYHKPLVLFNTNPIVQEARTNENEDEINVLKYLRENTLKRETSWSINIGLGNIKIESKDSKSLERKISENLDGVKVAYDGTRKYPSKLGAISNWWVDFDASMSEFEDKATMDHFQFGIGVFLEQEFKKSKKLKSKTNLLEQMIDIAVAWNCVPKKDFEEQIEKLRVALLRKEVEDIHFSHELYVKPEAIEDMKTNLLKLQETQSYNYQLLSKAFGKAMLYMGAHEYRKDIDKRTTAYAELWHYYLNNIHEITNYKVLANKAEQELKKVDRTLGSIEGNYNGSPGNLWFAEIIKTNRMGSIKGSFDRFSNGLGSILRGNIAGSKDSDRIIKKGFDNMTPFWSQSFQVRALGNYFVAVAKDFGVLDGVESKLTIKYKEGDKEKVIVLQKNN